MQENAAQGNLRRHGRGHEAELREGVMQRVYERRRCGDAQLREGRPALEERGEVLEPERKQLPHSGVAQVVVRLERHGGSLEGVYVGAEVFEPGTQRGGVRSAFGQPAEHAGHGLVYPVHTPPP